MAGIIQIYYKKTKIQKVKKTKNKIFVIKKKNNTKKVNITKTNPIKTTFSLNSEIIQAHNNYAYIMDLVDRGFDIYEIHEHILKKFKVNFKYEYLKMILNIDSEPYIPLKIIYNQNGKIRRNSTLYYEVE